MKRFRLRKRWLALPVAVVLLCGLYGVRWTLLGGWVRGLVERKLADLPGLHVSFGSLGGSIVSSLRLRDVHVVAPPGSSLEVADLGRVEVSYPWFGIGGVRIRAKNVDVRLATPPETATPTAAPLQEKIRDAIVSVEQARLPAAIELEDVTVVPPSGELLRIPKATLEGRSARGTLHSALTGTVTFSAALGADHRIDAEAVAERGPVSAFTLRLRNLGHYHALLIRCRAMDRDLRFGGRARFGSDERLDRVDGSFDVDESEARISVNLKTGDFRAESETALRLEREVSGLVTLDALLEGRLSDAPARWTISRLRIAGSGRIRDLPLSLEVSSSGGTLGDLHWQGTLRQGGDTLQATGHVGLLGGFGLVVDLRLDIRDLAAYGRLLPEGMTASAENISFGGQLHVDRQGPWIEGTFAAGPGKVNTIAWEEIRLAARLTGEELDVCELSAKGLPGLRQGALGLRVRLLGSTWATLLSRDTPGEASFLFETRSAIQTELPIGTLSDLRGEGRLGREGLEDLDIRGTLGDGGFRALARWAFRSPAGALVAHLMGEDLLVFSNPSARVRVSPNLWAERGAAGWKLSGSVELPTLLYYQDFGSPASSGTPASAAAGPGIRLPAAPGGGVLLPLSIPSPEPVELDVAVRTMAPVRIENSLVGALLGAELHVGGSLSGPVLSGVVEGHQGEVKLATGIVLRIDRLKLDLPGGPGGIPSVYFKAHSGKGEGAITAIVAGPLESPSLSLSSDPPKKQEELIAYLAFGHLPGDVGGSEALGMVAGKVFAGITDDRPKAEPKDGFWQRLDLGVTSEDAPDSSKRLPWELPPTTSARGTILRTEYLLSSLFSVVVESDREANVSGDLKIRFHFR
jgi:hypothetical protein